MKKSKLIIFSLVIFFIFSLFTLIFYFEYYIVDKETIIMNMTVANRVGFVVDNDALHFGAVYPGGQSRRVVTFENNYDFPTVVEIQSYGNMARQLVVSNNNFILEPGKSLNVSFTAHSPNNQELINVTLRGTVEIVFKRVLFN